MKITILLLIAIASGACSMQHAATSPYAGEERRDIKALSSAEVADLLAGKGMGFARAAELNGYPGPAHVLELAESLQLSTGQRAETRAIFTRMEAAARRFGAQLVEAERELDALFRERRVTPMLLRRQLEHVASLRASVRNAHLAAHLEQTGVLTREQVARYVALRGYADHHGAHGGHR